MNRKLAENVRKEYCIHSEGDFRRIQAGQGVETERKNPQKEYNGKLLIYKGLRPAQNGHFFPNPPWLFGAIFDTIDFLSPPGVGDQESCFPVLLDMCPEQQKRVGCLSGDELPIREECDVMQKKKTTTRTLKGEDPEPDQPAAEVKGMIPYPCCPKESVLVYAEAHGRCSQKCPCCGRFAVFDYDKMTAKPSRPRRGATEQFRPAQL